MGAVTAATNKHAVRLLVRVRLANPKPKPNSKPNPNPHQVMIITLTSSGNSARLIAKYRPRCPIAVVTRSAQVGAACNLHHGCMPILYPYPKPADLPAEGTDGDERLRWALRQLREQNLVEEGDYVVLAHGWKTGVESLATYRVLAVGDSLEEMTAVGRPEAK